MIIAIDFDGTCVKHEFPRIGADIGAIPVLKELVANGHKLILWTMRSRKKEGSSESNSLGWNNASKIKLESDVLQDAIDWFSRNDIPLWAVNINPNQVSWTNSPKAYAQYYIDDAALGTPVLFDEATDREYVDWVKMRELLVNNHLL